MGNIGRDLCVLLGEMEWVCSSDRLEGNSTVYLRLEEVEPEARRR